jgi:XTP/dITP diphosphohydrolase
MDERLKAFERVLNTMDDLRAMCPWDKKQTNESLRPLTIEETYELAEAILENDDNKIKEELGDLLLHIVFYAKIGDEKKAFDIKDVCDNLVEKLVERHPHIYGNVKVADDEEVKENWEKIKLKDKKKTTLSGVPASLPALIKSIRIQDKVKGVGFDWDKQEDVWEKMNEELNEFKSEIQENTDISKVEEEFGDILFTLVNLSRFYKINPENALEKTNKKFINRFQKMENLIQLDKKEIGNLKLSEMEEYWQKAKNSISG